MKRFSVAFFCFLLLAASLSPVSGQTDCPSIVQEALEVTGRACEGVGRNQACYGHVNLTPIFRAEITDVRFTEAGDLIDLDTVQSLALSAMDLRAASWGVAVLRVQANLPDTLPGQNVTVLMFGEVDITDAGSAPQRSPEDDALNPMQAFYFHSGVGDAPCAEAPDSGILIQTPEGAGAIELTIDDVHIMLASTIYLQAEAGGNLVISTVEGEATVEAAGVTRVVPAGMQVTVPLDADLHAAGAPSEPVPYEASGFAALPVRLLPRAIEITALSGAGKDEILPGTWTITDAVVVENPCSLTMPGTIVEGMRGTSFEIKGSTLLDLITIDAGAPNGEIELVEIEPGVYRDEQEGQYDEYRIISPTQVNMRWVTSGECSSVIDFTMQNTSG